MNSNDVIIDEGVLDTLKSAGGKIGDYGRQVKSALTPKNPDYNPQDPDGLNKGDPKFGYDPDAPDEQEKPEKQPKAKRVTMPRQNNQQSLAREYFTSNFVDMAYDLVADQLESENSYVARPGQSPDDNTQVTLQLFLQDWYDQYTDGLNINPQSRFGKLAVKYFEQMQANWDNGVFDTKILAQLGGQTFSYANAPQSPMNRAEPSHRTDTSKDAEAKRKAKMPNEPIIPTDPVTESAKRAEKMWEDYERSNGKKIKPWDSDLYVDKIAGQFNNNGKLLNNRRI